MTNLLKVTSNNPPFGIAMRANTHLANDGVSTSLLSFAVYDKFGLPVVGQMVEFELNGADHYPLQLKQMRLGLPR